jgi:hypothetical protein
MNRLPPTNWNNTPSFQTETIIYDNKEQNNDRLLNRHFLFSEIERNTPLVPNNFVSSSRKKGISTYNETIEKSNSIYNSSLFNDTFINNDFSQSTPIHTPTLEYNKGRSVSGWIDFSKPPQLKKEDEYTNDNRLSTHIFDTLGHKHKNQGERPIALPSNPWSPSS